MICSLPQWNLQKQKLCWNSRESKASYAQKILRSAAFPPEYLWQFYQKGKLERSGRGVYRLPTYELTEHHSLAEAAKLVPRGVVCLLSALRFHELTTQSPFEVWLAIDRKAHKSASGQTFASQAKL